MDSHVAAMMWKRPDGRVRDCERVLADVFILPAVPWCHSCRTLHAHHEATVGSCTVVLLEGVASEFFFTA